MKKIIGLLLLSFICIISACSSNESAKELPSKVYSTVSEDDFNRDLFYMNTLEFKVADPTVIYVEEGKGAGYFYAFGTSDLIGCHGIQCWRSKDLANWEYQGVALQPDGLNTWAVDNYWAPEIIYDNGKYYLFYNADKIVPGQTEETRCLSVAVSENVMGPYVNVGDEGLTNLVSTDSPVFDFHSNQHLFPEGITVRDSAIDASPFIDPKTGERYLYWSWYDENDKNVDTADQPQEIFGMKMTDWFTPQYDTITQITELGKTTVGGSTEISEGDRLNEGPFMYYKDGQYLLTFSTYNYKNPNYQVRLAIGDSPLGGFEKVALEDGGVVLSTGESWSHMASAGHHQFVPVGDQLLVVYHTFYDRATFAELRSLAVDEVKFVKNKKGQTTIHTNGPTYSLQPIPSKVSGYEDVATKATVSATNVVEGSSKEYLNDGLIKYKENDLAQETAFNAGKASITFTFDTPQQLKSVMVYNSYDIETAFGIYPDYGEKGVKSIELEYVCDSKGNTKTAVINDVLFDYNFYTFMLNDIYPGASAVAEFNDLPVVKVTINMENAIEYSISEVSLLAATNKTVDYVGDISKVYNYNNNIELNHYVNEGTTLGGTEFYDATYGWDLSTDDGTDNAYALTHGLGDSYVYFKDVSATKFYAEGYISTFASYAYPLGNEINDPFPKMGMCVRNNNGCLFFYIDASEQFTNKAVGYVQSEFGNKNWDFSSTEELYELDIKYRNSELNLEENFVKFAILRDGAKFYMLVNDQIIFTSNSVRGIKANDLAGVGFLGFNSPMVIKDYSVTTNSQAIDMMLEEYLGSYTGDVESETLGNGKFCDATLGWDLEQADNLEHPYTVNEKISESFVYLKENNLTKGTKFYVEGLFGTTSFKPFNNEEYPKFGITVKNHDAYFLFYVDGQLNFTTKRVGFVHHDLNDPSLLDWSTSKEFDVNIEYANSSLQLNGNYVKLGLLRDGDIFYLLVNDEVICEVSGIDNLGALDYADVGFVTFNTPLVVKDYSYDANEANIDAKVLEFKNAVTSDILGDGKLSSATTGWDLTNDESYVINNKNFDSNIYFKENNSTSGTKFYVEGYFGTTKPVAFNGDGFPKFGFTLRNNNAYIMFYVDGSEGFSKKVVGIVESAPNQLGEWNWAGSKEYPVDITYRNNSLQLNGNFVKLGLLRDGANIYLFVNDVLIHKATNLYGLGTTDYSDVGFLTMNTPLVVKDYSIITNITEVDNKLNELHANSAGNVLGDGKVAFATTGWDLTNDNKENGYVVNEKDGDSIIYFKESHTNKFYVEGWFATTSYNAFNGDGYPKFGFTLKSAKTQAVFYVDGSNNYQTKRVGLVQRDRNNPNDWAWGESKEFDADIIYRNNSLNLNGNFVKLGLLRDGNKLYLFVNDELVYKVANYYGLGSDEYADVGFLTFNTPLLVKNYSITTSEADVDTKLSQLVVTSGAVLGDGPTHFATMGWNTTNDNGTADGYVTNNAAGDAFIYFKEESTKFYVEGYVATMSDTAYNNDGWPKFGLIIRNDKAASLFFVDGCNSYNNPYVGFVESIPQEPGQWNWGTERVFYVNGLSYKNNSLNLNGNFAKLAILRDGETFYFFANDLLVYTANSLYDLGADDLCDIGFFAFQTQMVVKGYSLTTNEAVVNEKLASINK